MRGRAAGDDDLADALRAQVLRGQRADLAGADDQHAPALESPEDLPRQRHRREADRHRAFAERRLGADALADAERPVKQLAQHRPGAAPAGGGLERVLHLSEDLRLADDQRVEAGGDAEQMLRRRLVAEREQVRREALGRQRMVVAEERDDVLARPRRGSRWPRRSRTGCTWTARPTRRPMAAWPALRRRRRGRGSRSRAVLAGPRAPSCD